MNAGPARLHVWAPVLAAAVVPPAPSLLATATAAPEALGAGPRREGASLAASASTPW